MSDFEFKIDLETIFIEATKSTYGIIAFAMLVLGFLTYMLFRKSNSNWTKITALLISLGGLLIFVGVAISSQNLDEREKAAENKIDSKPNKVEVIKPAKKKSKKMIMNFGHWNKKSSGDIVKNWEIKPTPGYKIIPNSVKMKFYKKGKESSAKVTNKSINFINITATMKNYGGFFGQGQARGHVEI